MNERKHPLAAAGVLLSLLLAAEVRAEPPPGSPAKAEAAPGKAPVASPTPKSPDAKAAGQEPGQPGKGLAATGPAGKGPEGKGLEGAHGQGAAAGPDKAAPGAQGLRGHSELRLLRDELKAGKLKKEELEGRLAKLRESNQERQANHRAALKARWGEQLAKPDAQQELALHEKRMAQLNRMLLLTQTERKGKDAEQLSERIEKLIELETTRHEKRMASISGTAPAAASPPAAVNTEVTK